MCTQPYDPGLGEQRWDEHLTFAVVRGSEWGFKEHVWKKSAHDVASRICQGEHVAIRLGTGGGKTIIALLAAIALNARTLVLVPTRYLANQHDALLREILGASFQTRIITGETHKRERIWNDPRDRFVFATGAVCASALRADAHLPTYFNLTIVDEFHRARGKYDYVRLMPSFFAYEVPRIALSASPGSHRSEVEQALLYVGTSRLISPSMCMPLVTEDTYFVELSSEMKRAEEQGWRELEGRIRSELARYGCEIPDGVRYSSSRLTRYRKMIQSLPQTERTRRLRMAFAKYRLFLYGHVAFVIQSYESFLAFVERIQTRNRPSDRALLHDDLFRRLIATARHYRDQHPKVRTLERIMERLARERKRAIVFFADRATARYCEGYLNQRGVHVATAFGGSSMSSQSLHEAIEHLKEGRVAALLATSVLHEGVSIPDVDYVVNFSVASSAIVRLQSAGRTGRIRPGKILHLIMSHDLDRNMYVSVTAAMRSMRVLYDQVIDPEGRWHGQPSLFLPP